MTHFYWLNLYGIVMGKIALRHPYACLAQAFQSRPGQRCAYHGSVLSFCQASALWGSSIQQRLPEVLSLIRCPGGEEDYRHPTCTGDAVCIKLQELTPADTLH